MLFILKKIAGALIKKYKPVVICITGSVGKTSTKDAVSAGLSTSFIVRKTPKNLNNEYGVPISIIGGFKFKEGFWALLRICINGLKQLYFSSCFPNVLVIEVGAGRIGEIKEVAEWLKPNIVVVTNLPDKPSHLGVFGSKEKIIIEKKWLVDAMDSNGKLFIDTSEKNMRFFTDGFKGSIKNYDSSNLEKFSNYEIIYNKTNGVIIPIGMKINLGVTDDKKMDIEFRGFIGVQNIKALVIAKLIAIELGCLPSKIVEGLKKYSPEAGRLKIISGKAENVTIIDDSFNSSPIAVENSLKNFLSIKKNSYQRTIAVLGDMLNLGAESADIHKSTIQEDVSLVDILITVGGVSKEWQAFNPNKLELNKHFKNSTNAAKYIETIQKSGDLILFKGGHLTRLEKAVKILGICSKDNLVRQEDYWQKEEFELYNQESDEKQNL
jgi:UDP-N-acetylmuramoyl-tripeptide--D-alanyl-D-alanine ligase